MNAGNTTGIQSGGISAFTHPAFTQGAEKIVALKQTEPAFREAL